MPIQIKGHPYWKVSERIAMAKKDGGFTMLSSEIVECNGRFFCRVTVDIQGSTFIGTSEVRFTNFAPKSMDEYQPIESAEGRALGRALSFAGYGR